MLADRAGTRIGHGKGHYDRALAHLREGGPVFTIGLGWERQIIDDPIPADPWDMHARRARDAEGVDHMRVDAELAQAGGDRS